jgi:hypothetical protein
MIILKMSGVKRHRGLWENKLRNLDKVAQEVGCK